MNDNAVLFQPLRVGAVELPHRIVMAPLTRARATDRVPNDVMAKYYRQRAGAALIISEATAISPQAYGWHGAPGIYTAEQVAGWRRITDGVHAAGGRIFIQLWHMGRVSHPDYQNGSPPVGPSSIAAVGEAHTPAGKKPFVVPRELDTEEIVGIVNDFAQATRLACEAGFDGVEIHAANGYLIDQFLRDGSNRRNDQFGGSLENRFRFLSQILEAGAAAWSADRIGVRLSPTNSIYGMRDSDPVALFTYVADRLNDYGLAYVHTAEGIQPGRMYNPDVPRVTPLMRQAYHGVLFANGGYEKQTAAEAIRGGAADAIAFGQAFIANPDLPVRLAMDAPLNEAHSESFYTGTTAGYIDYPALHSMPATQLVP